MAANYTAILEVQHHVLTCVCSALTETALAIEGQPGCPCRSGLTPGSSPLICCASNGCADTEQGQLTVGLGRSWRTSSFPQQDTTELKCNTPGKTLAVEFIVTLVRCIPVINERGVFPSMEAQTAAAEIAAIDWMSMEIAVECCVPQMPGRRKDLRVSVQDHRSIGPTGPNGPSGADAKCAGSEMRLVIDVGAVCCPDVPS